MSELKLRYTISERPAQAPAGWRIMNAARELPGSQVFEEGRYQGKDWQGPFVKGIYYSAIDPKDDLGHVWLQTCAELDACELVYITEQQAYDVGLAYYQTNYPDELAEIKMDEQTRKWIIDRGYDLLNNGEATL